MINKPPKPPCWRDFEHDPGRSQQRKSSSHGRELVLTDLSHLHRSSSDGEATTGTRAGGGASRVAPPSVTTAAATTTSKSQHHKKNKRHDRSGKLHRTRSELSISKADLPEVQHMTINLADAPKEGLFRGGSRNFDAQIYLDDNAIRCEKWLKDVHASQPLTDVAFSQGSGDELEIPEENWEDLERLKASPALASTSGSDIDSVSVCGCGGRRPGSAATNDKTTKSRGKSRRYSDIRVPHRTRDIGIRAQTLPTPGKLKKLARLAESRGESVGGSGAGNEGGSDRTRGQEGEGQTDGQQKTVPRTTTSEDKVIKTPLRKVSDIEKLPFKDQTHAWQVTEIDQSLLVDKVRDPHRDVSITCTGTPSELDRKLTDSAENLLELGAHEEEVALNRETHHHRNPATISTVDNAENINSPSLTLSETASKDTLLVDKPDNNDNVTDVKLEPPDPGKGVSEETSTSISNPNLNSTNSTNANSNSIQVSTIDLIDISLGGSHL